MRSALFGVAVLLSAVGLARAGTLATWDYGNLGVAGDDVPLTSANISLQLTDEDENVIQTLFNKTITAPGNYTFTASSATEPNWAAAIAFLKNGDNHGVYLNTKGGDYSEVTGLAYLLPLPGLSWPTIFSSKPAFEAATITSLTLTITNFQFTNFSFPGFGSVYGFEYNATLSFNDGAVAAASVPTPTAAVGGVAALAMAGLRRRR